MFALSLLIWRVGALCAVAVGVVGAATEGRSVQHGLRECWNDSLFDRAHTASPALTNGAILSLF